MGLLLKPDKKAPQVFGRKTRHIRQIEKVYGMGTIITIVKTDYCLMSQLLSNILSNVTLPPYPSFFVHFKHTFVTHPTKISRFSITVTPPPRDTACHPPKILNVHLLKHWAFRSRASPGGGVFHPSAVTTLSLKVCDPNFVQNYFGVRSILCDKKSRNQTNNDVTVTSSLL